MVPLTKLAISNSCLNSNNAYKMSVFRKIQSLAIIKYGRWSSQPPHQYHLSSSSPLLLFSTSHKHRPFPKPRHITFSSPNPIDLKPMDTIIASNPHSNGASSDEVLHSFLFFDVYKDGRVNVFSPPSTIIPAADDPLTGVKIKDVQISPEVSVRMFLPPSAAASTTKLPVLLYIHGGGFCMHSAFNAEYTNLMTNLVAKGDIIAVSVEYRLFPSASIAACYDDSWAALQWVSSHSTGSGPDEWLNSHADLNRIYVGGDSAGGNITHTVAVRAGSSGLDPAPALAGTILIHPYFGEDDKMWMYMCDLNEDPRDRRMWAHPEDLGRVGCGRVLVFVGEKDGLREAGTGYVEKLKKSGWKGTVEIVENKDRDHCFHVSNPEDPEAVDIQKRIISFINHN